MKFRASLVAIFTSILWFHVPAQAGDRDLEILVVNMTPDAASDEASRTCFQRVLRGIRNDGTHLLRRGETGLLRLVQRDDPREFMSWPDEALTDAHSRVQTHNIPLDSIALVDCRPSEQSLVVRVSSPSGATSRIRLGGFAVEEHAAFVARRIRDRAWAGWSP